jgi:hypothetical protein
MDRDLFLSVPEFRNTIIAQYENFLGGKKNLLLKLLNKPEKEIKEVILKDNKEDRFTELYSITLDSFIQKVFVSHKDVKIKKIILLGGITSNNKKYLEKYLLKLEKKLKIESEIIDDKFIGVKGALLFYKEKQKNL